MDEAEEAAWVFNLLQMSVLKQHVASCPVSIFYAFLWIKLAVSMSQGISLNWNGSI